MGLSAEISILPPVERKAARKPVKLGAGLRQRGTPKVTVDLLDLSTHGFKIETYTGLYAGAEVWITLPGLQGSHARVAWVEGPFAGCEFLAPLHPAVLDMMVGRGR